MFERDLLHILGFDFHVDHPHGYIMRQIAEKIIVFLVQILMMIIVRESRFARFFDSVKRDKESRALVMSSSEEDRFTEFGHLVRSSAKRE